MPSRVIRGEINSSESLSRVSICAELTFTRLLTYVDDYGRGDARLAMAKAGLFPLRDEVSLEDLERWLDELGAEGCVAFYLVGGRPYLHLTGWEKHRGNTKRAKTSRFPEPLEITTESGTPENPPDILGNLGDPPGGKESGVRSRVSGGVDASAPTDTGRHNTRSKKPPPRPWALHLSAHLIKCLTEVPGARIPNGAGMRWAREIERMPNEIPELKLILMQGGPERLQQRIEVAISDATGPEAMRSENAETRRFSPQIRCGKSLREKWDQITAAAARRPPPNISPADFAREVAEM